jgi:hypothetical protein
MLGLIARVQSLHIPIRIRLAQYSRSVNTSTAPIIISTSSPLPARLRNPQDTCFFLNQAGRKG